MLEIREGFIGIKFTVRFLFIFCGTRDRQFFGGSLSRTVPVAFPASFFLKKVTGDSFGSCDLVLWKQCNV